ncbi:MAG: HDIG domain-containing metalloprotein [Candidatus Promineifilaceae bacterium]
MGGAVRDLMLRRPVHDLDFVADEDAIGLAFAVGDALGRPAYVLDRERDAGRVVLADGMTLDFSGLRGPDLEGDLLERDFSINAIAHSTVGPNAIMDPAGGLPDLDDRLVSQASPGAIARDPVRALRAIRLARALDFAIEAETAAAVMAAGPGLAAVSRERIRDELLRLLALPEPAPALADLDRFGLLSAALPPLAALAGVEQAAPHHEPALEHTLTVLSRLTEVEAAVAEPAATGRQGELLAALAPFGLELEGHLNRKLDGGLDGRQALRLAALLHDVGKAETATLDAAGRIRFFGHDALGARLAERTLRDMRLSREAVAHVSAVVAGHMRPLLLAQAGGPSRRATFRFFRDLGRAGLDVCLLTLADHLATHAGPGPAESRQSLAHVVRELLGYYWRDFEERVRPPALLTGQDLLDKLNIKSGPEVGRLLRLVEEAQAAGEIATPAEALELARRSLR